MRFWCSNDGRNWTWNWQPYWGAWVIVAALAFAFWKGGTFDKAQPRNRKIAVVLGLFLLLAGTDWPLASLGAGYMVTAQMIRQIIIVMIACPLLLWGAPPSLGRWLVATERRKTIYRVITSPKVTLPVALGLLMAVTAPVVVEDLVTSQLGSFAMDVIWMTAGLLIWLPVQAPRPLRARLQGPPLVVYLIIVSVVPLPIAFFMTWSPFPIFEVYENSPRVFDWLSAEHDQELGAAIFQVAGGLVIWAQIAVRFITMSKEGKDQPKFRGKLIPSASHGGPS
ncbi:MAG: cytochrome c oxidase assembly protein [Actinobacteria bacterium]|nr:cytochrome c oxidase assembly protein [Actinomycetota bacterium]